jgi:hypothetical protein
MRQFSPNCFEKIKHEQPRAVIPGSCTLMSYLTNSQNTVSAEEDIAG